MVLKACDAANRLRLVLENNRENSTEIQSIIRVIKVYDI